MYVIVTIKRLRIPGATSVVDCTHFPGKELHRHVGMDRMVTSGSLDGGMVSTVAQNARDVGSIPILCAIFKTINGP